MPILKVQTKEKNWTTEPCFVSKVSKKKKKQVKHIAERIHLFNEWKDVFHTYNVSEQFQFFPVPTKCSGKKHQIGKLLWLKIIQLSVFAKELCRLEHQSCTVWNNPFSTKHAKQADDSLMGCFSTLAAFLLKVIVEKINNWRYDRFPFKITKTNNMLTDLNNETTSDSFT